MSQKTAKEGERIKLIYGKDFTVYQIQRKKPRSKTRIEKPKKRAEPKPSFPEKIHSILPRTKKLIQAVPWAERLEERI